MEGLSLDNIMTGEEAANLFSQEQESTEENEVETPKDKEEKENKEATEVVDVNSLFTEEPESVGSGDNNKEKEDTTSKEGTSPNFYSSIAKTFAEDGVFQNLDEEALSKVNDAESFLDLVEQQVQSKLDEKQKRIDQALNAGTEPTQIQRFENNMKILNSITEDSISEEGEKGENLRKNIIYEDYIQKGFSKERAIKAVERSIAAGTDIEDAKEALQSCKDQVNKAYNDAIKKAEEEKANEEKELKEQAEALKKLILSDKKPFGDLEIDKSTRQRVFDAISKPVFTDPETGERLTALQKYEADNHNDFMKYVGLTYVLTDGFKSLDGLVKGKVKKEVGKSLKELEHTLNNTARNSNGTLKFTSGVSSDSESAFSRYTLDI
jgi:hypothetical protein|nr:MAG TPA: hypothetical protein [Crassvirales sp.]